MKKYIFEGNEYKQGTHDVPSYYPNTDRMDWFWQVDTKHEENRFLPKSVFIKNEE